MCNVPANSIEKYYYQILFIPIIDNVLEDIRDSCLNDNNKKIYLLMQPIPLNTTNIFLKTNDDCKKQLVTSIHPWILNLFKGELELWKINWTTKNNE